MRTWPRSCPGVGFSLSCKKQVSLQIVTICSIVLVLTQHSANCSRKGCGCSTHTSCILHMQLLTEYFPDRESQCQMSHKLSSNLVVYIILRLWVLMIAVVDLFYIVSSSDLTLAMLLSCECTISPQIKSCTQHYAFLMQVCLQH